MAHQAAEEPQAVVERLYAAHALRLAGLARALTGSIESGDDLVQDAFVDLLQVCTRQPGYVREPAWPLLRTIIVRLAAQRRRGIVRELRRMMRLREQCSETTWTVDLDVVEALMTLPPRMRACVVLHYLEDLPIFEVAMAMNTRPGTVTAQLFSARRRLRDLLGTAGTAELSAELRRTWHGQ
jgi:RNA polymerase sigma-70 factor (ECF subfamily)